MQIRLQIDHLLHKRGTRKNNIWNNSKVQRSENNNKLDEIVGVCLQQRRYLRVPAENVWVDKVEELW